ncbi:MAG TPA: RNA polymerase sigma factor SigJ [Mycobacteriales bacterium]|nr:RNA polymerase sigma factor SigJ [Mycobacteriales bacterium]
MTDTWAPEDLRGYAFAVAYRMLGSVSEAEDVVQEAMLRLHAADRSEVRSPTAYTATVTTRLALDELRSARARRERYVGTWLPEPVLGEADPAERVELRESLAAAFLLVLETLGPVERAVFVLHDLFDVPYGEVAEVVDRTEVACRQIAARARRHVAARQQRFDPPAAERDRLVRRFLAAIEAGDVAGLERMLAADVTFHGDGGASGLGIKHPVPGPLRVARLLAGIVRQARRYGLRLDPAVVNGGPGARVVDQEDRLLNVFALDVRDGQVVAVRSVINPDKLRHLGPLIDPAELASR